MNSGNVSVPKLTLPKGGGAVTGIGETFQPNAFTGSASLSIPIHTSPCRGFEPHLSVDYSSGSGNGVFGIGFSLAIPNISRKTEKGFPKYDPTDTFLISNADDLVPRLVRNENGEWKPEEQSDRENGYSIIQYRPRTEGLFARIEKWVDNKDGDIHWRVTTKDNVTSIYGQDPGCKIADGIRVFQWLLQETCDAKRNIVRYEYDSDNARIPEIVDKADAHGPLSNRYIRKIKYGRYLDKSNQEQWHFELIFDYRKLPPETPDSAPESESDRLQKPEALPKPDTLTFDANKGWAPRLDPHSSYRAGFEIRTQRLCQRILLFHRFGDNTPFLVHGTHFAYTETPCMSFLSQVTQVGYRKENGIIQSKAMPPLVLKYSKPEHGPDFKSLTHALGNGKDVEIHRRIDELVDLYGDGLPGILHSDDHTTLYSRPQGGGRYAAAKQPAHFPIDRNLDGGQYALLDLGGDGELDLVAQTHSGSGYFQSNPEEETWEPYRAFPAYPTDVFSEDRQMVDVTGDGLADLVMFETNAIKIYRSRGKEGFTLATVQTRNDDDLPLTRQGSAVEYVGFADLFGDGGNHLVRIRSGSVQCWPHLGYGRFGQKVCLKNSPDFDGPLDPSRLFLADIDGSGTTDLVYAYRDHLKIYRNQSGNGFAATPERLPLPHAYDNLNHIRFADVLGNGTACLILTSRHVDLRLRHAYFDFNAAGKPHLLIGIDNQMGAEKKIHYAASTRFYLDDLTAGRPWATRLSFPVQVVERVEVIDRIAGSRLVTRYAYHDGYYDREEREFRGFGYVEQWDTESSDEHREWVNAHKEMGNLALPLGVDEDSASYAAPIYTRSWFHTGAASKANGKKLSNHYQDRYYDGDPHSGHLPDSALDQAIFHPWPEETIAEAYRALHGHRLREEIYGLDARQNPELVKHPYAVTESNFKIRLLQPIGDQKHAVCFVHPAEEISWHYERNPKDPRVEHSFTLEVDDYGNVIKSCHVFYPRRDEPKAHAPEQAALKIITTENRFINADACEDANLQYCLLGVPCEEKVYELGGLRLDGHHLFTASQIAACLNKVSGHEVPFEQTLTGEDPQARLLSWERHFYWDQALHKPLELGAVAGHALHHHSETAVFSREAVAGVFAGKVGAENLTPMLAEAGYGLKEDGYWWNPGVAQHYRGSDDFYLPDRTVDPFGTCTHVAYDEYRLVPVAVVDALGNQTQAEIDDHTLQPWRITDINDNISEALFDPLGMVIATSVYGAEGGEARGDDQLRARVGDDADDNPPVAFRRSQSSYVGLLPTSGDTGATLREIVRHPGAFLQNATTCFHYVLAYDGKQPPHAVSLMRERHVHDPETSSRANGLGSGVSSIHVHIAYSDGFGRALQSKVRAGEGMAFLRDENGVLRRDQDWNLLEDTVDVRWLTSGRTVYNNKGKPVKQYEPFYSATSTYEPERDLQAYGVTHVTHYDPLGRVVRVDTPDGFFSKVEFTPWEETHFDENDTVKKAPFYIANNGKPGLDPAVQDTLSKAGRHHDTPETHLLDTQGRAFQVIQRLEGGEQRITCHEFDIQGHELSSTDPRLYGLNQQHKTSHRNFRHKYDMVGGALWTWSADAGDRWVLHNALGNPIHIWDSRDFQTSIGYDALQRAVEVHVKGNDRKGLVLDNVVEKMAYGEGQVDDKKRNLRGKLLCHYDQAGVVIFDSYDIKGEPIKTTRRLRRAYKQEAHWPESGEEELLEGERFDVNHVHDALGRVIRETHPDGSISTPQYGPEGWLKRVDVKLATSPNEKPMPFVRRISYNAKGQRKEINYGNGVTTTYDYDLKTFRLKTLKTERAGATKNGNASTLQDIAYTYDPVGNITRIRDASHQAVFAGQQEVQPLCDYTYDALYRLVAATGREHPALAGNEHQSTANEAFKQTRFLNLNDRTQLRLYHEKYAYDPGGNLARIQHHTAQPCGSWTRDLGVAGTTNRAVPGNPAPDPAIIDTFFDTHGNQARLDTVVGNIRWSYRDNIAGVDLIKREDRPSDAEYYVYDGGGQRIRKVSETLIAGEIVEITETIYLGGVEIKRVKRKEGDALKTNAERWSLHVSDGHERIAIAHHWSKGKRAEETQLRYQLGNHLGSAALELTENAQVISYEEYFPYGGTSLIAGEDKTEVRRKTYRYSGKERDDSTGLYYYGARYYAPWLGRWMSPDPAGTVDGLNLYAFVRGNPIRLVDPVGLASKESRGRKPRTHNRKIKPYEGTITADEPKKERKKKNSSRGGNKVSPTFLGDIGRTEAATNLAHVQGYESELRVLDEVAARTNPDKRSISWQKLKLRVKYGKKVNLSKSERKILGHHKALVETITGTAAQEFHDSTGLFRGKSRTARKSNSEQIQLMLRGKIASGVKSDNRFDENAKPQHIAALEKAMFKATEKFAKGTKDWRAPLLDAQDKAEKIGKFRDILVGLIWN